MPFKNAATPEGRLLRIIIKAAGFSTSRKMDTIAFSGPSKIADCRFQIAD
jgi:hypothetical protein